MAEGFICRRGGGSSGKSEIIVTAPTGSTVTATLGTTVKTAVEQAGQWVFKNCDLGTWKIEARLSGQTATKNVEIQEDGQLMRYYVTLSFWTATITVTYPAGAVCTCSNGSTILTAPDTSGSHTFTVTTSGEWTIKAVDGSKSKSVTVNATEQKQYTASIVFELILFDWGEHNSDVTGGFSKTSEVNLDIGDTIDVNTWSGTTDTQYISTKNKIDVSGYSTLYVRAKVVWDSRLCYVGLTDTSLSDSWAASAAVGGEQNGEYKLYQIDISAVSGSYYFTATSRDSGNQIEIAAIWLE